MSSDAGDSPRETCTLERRTQPAVSAALLPHGAARSGSSIAIPCRRIDSLPLTQSAYIQLLAQELHTEGRPEPVRQLAALLVKNALDSEVRRMRR